MLGELLLAEEQLVGIGFSRQALAVGVGRVAGVLLGAVNVPEVEVHVVRDNGRDDTVLQEDEDAHGGHTQDEKHYGQRRESILGPFATVVCEETHQVGDGDHDDGHADEHHGQRYPDVQQGTQNQAVVANRVAHLDGGGFD